MNKLIACIIFLLLCLVSSHLFAQVDIEAGRQLYLTRCVACHGTNGNASIDQWPKLAGQHQSYLIKQLNEYKKGTEGRRYNAVMYSIAKDLSKTDIDNITAYLTVQIVTPGATKRAEFAHGQKLYRGGDRERRIPACTACHGPRGEGNAFANYPAVSGQNAAYLIERLTNLRNEQDSHSTFTMHDIATRLNDADMRAVASYMAGVH
jgi:cytochrome c553